MTDAEKMQRLTWYMKIMDAAVMLSKTADRTDHWQEYTLYKFAGNAAEVLDTISETKDKETREMLFDRLNGYLGAFARTLDVMQMQRHKARPC